MKMEGITKLKNSKDLAKVMSLIDFDAFYNIIWVLAKTADPKISEPLEWLDGFDEFPLFEIILEVQDLIIASIQGKKK
jgi:hypothetical protein